jgi:hypothetical protein
MKNFASRPRRCGLHRRGHTRLVVLAILAVLVACWSAWYLLRPRGQPDADEGRSVAEQFLRRLEQGHAAEAWNSTTAEFKSARGKEAFSGDVAARDYLRQRLDFVSVQSVQVGAQPRSEVLFRATGGQTVRIVLAREQGQWKVDRWNPQ